jgi:rare lipoprotein A
MFVRLVLGAALVMLPLLAAGSPGTDRNASPGRAGAKPKAPQVGLASYYGPGLQGRKTASGEIFDKSEMVAAHPSYPLGTRARVTNLRNGKSQEVRIIDRGPVAKHQYRGVVIDVSEAVAMRLGFRKKGKTRVSVQVLEWGERDAN